MKLPFLILAFLLTPALHAQATSTAAERFQLSVFGAGSGVYTGLNRGRNLSLTAGVDLGLRRYFGLNPSLEIRGTYPIDDGQVVGQRNVLGGLRVAGTIGRLHPYADILFGRGELKYNPPLLAANGTLLYTQTASNIFSPGVGADLTLSPHFSLLADLQLQHYSSPIPASGSFYAKPITVGVRYRFDFNRLLRLH